MVGLRQVSSFEALGRGMLQIRCCHDCIMDDFILNILAFPFVRSICLPKLQVQSSKHFEVDEEASRFGATTIE
jgi:hypothetical protein